jgi:hypothetical protein
MRLPIDTQAMTILAAGAAEPVIDFESRRPKTDPVTGEALFAVQLVLLAGDAAEVVSVKLAGEPPALTVGAPVAVTGLVATPWAMGERSGIAFRAARLTAGPTVSGSSKSGGEGR